MKKLITLSLLLFFGCDKSTEPTVDTGYIAFSFDGHSLEINPEIEFNTLDYNGIYNIYDNSASNVLDYTYDFDPETELFLDNYGFNKVPVGNYLFTVLAPAVTGSDATTYTEYITVSKNSYHAIYGATYTYSYSIVKFP